MRTLVVLCLSLSIAGAARLAQANVCGQPSDALILLDRSGSMDELVGGQTKWSIAVAATNSMTSTFAGQINFGLMLFSRHPFVANCSSGKANVNIGPNTQGAISSLLTQITPQGDTPLSLSLDEARVYLQANPSANPRYVILVTDGKETCQPVTVNSPPIAAGKLLGVGVKTYVVGFGGAVDPTSLTDTAVAGGTSSYYQASDLPTLNAALKKIAGAISCCGDGKLDPGEVCDIAIAPGSPGACATAADCDDKNPCTDDSLVAKGCSTTCYHSVITTPQNGDGCCPPGANSATDSDCPASCGNGVVDPGEKCDTGIPSGVAGGCPTTCDDGNPCTQDVLNGNGCDAFCTNVNTCPTDLCGNGKVDNGEWCDTAIPAGQPGACPKVPQDCNDGNACTLDALMGTDCVAVCTHKPITTPASGDGCCPAGATPQNDSDCAGTQCGNGVVDAGETCDPGILWGPGACQKNCDDADACTKDLLAGSACNVECAHTAVAPNLKTKDGCCPKGLTSKQDVDCPTVCDPDSQEGCIADPCRGVTCLPTQVCSKGTCVAKTPTDPPNPEGPGASVDGGCNCRVAGRGAGLPAALLILLVLGLAALARRR
jgi:MYXO-CTERM domain-containing protein